MKRVSLSAVTAVLSSLLVLPASGPAAAATAAAPATATSYHATAGRAGLLGASPRGVSGLRPISAATRPQARLARPLSSIARATTTAPSASPGLPVVDTPSAAPDRQTSVTHAFNGLSDLDSQNLNGFPIPANPPDQGLCVGRDDTLPGGPTAVWEPINVAARETSVTGARLRPDVTLATLFQNPNVGGDVRCVYDAETRSFYFTEIGFPATISRGMEGNNTTADVVVVNARGAAAYQFDTSLGGTCFGDQPKVGFDRNALVISTDEFCGPTDSQYAGAIVLAISKPQLVAEDKTVADAVLGPVSQAGVPVTGLDPAIGTDADAEYLVDSVPFLADGSNNPVGNTLGLWTLRDDASVTTGRGTPTLAGAVLPSEPYGFPVPATSTGDGSTRTVDGLVVTSETALNPDDSRISGPVSVIRSPGGIRLWTALDAAVLPHGDSAQRDAAAWFQIDPARQAIVSQGYVAATGQHLLYPAILAPRDEPPQMVFTVTGAAVDPSAAYTRLGSGRITIVARGAGPHLSYSDAPPFSQPRWGDYSFAALDPDRTGVWLATEYIPPTASQDPRDNWGTYVFEVSDR